MRTPSDRDLIATTWEPNAGHIVIQMRKKTKPSHMRVNCFEKGQNPPLPVANRIVSHVLPS